MAETMGISKAETFQRFYVILQYGLREFAIGIVDLENSFWLDRDGNGLDGNWLGYLDLNKGVL